jgi:MFS family permease
MRHNHANVIRYFPALLCLYELIGYLSNDAYLPAMPSMANEFGVSHHLVMLTITAWFAGGVLFQLWFGPLSDRFGRRFLMLLSSIFFLSGSLACALAPTMSVLLLSRMVQGLGVSGLIVAGYACLHELFAQRRAIELVATISGITIVGPGLGPLVGAMIMHGLSWRWIFALTFISGLIVAVGMYRWMPESLPLDQRHAFNVKRIVKSYAAVLINVRFIRCLLISNLLFSGLMAWIAIGPFLVIDDYHQSAYQFSLYQIVVFGGFVVGTQMTKYLAGKMNLMRLVHLGLGIALCAVLVLLAVTFWLRSTLFFPAVIMGGLMVGAGVAFPVLNRLTIESSEEPMGTKVAISSWSFGLFGAITTVLAGWVYQNTFFSLAELIAGFTILAFALSWLQLRATRLD